MFRTINRVIRLSGSYRHKITAGIVFSMLHSVFSALDLLAVLWILSHLEEIMLVVIWQAAGILLVGFAGKFLCKWLGGRALSNASYDNFRDKRIEVGNRLKSAPMGYFQEQTLGAIQTAVTTGINDLEGGAIVAVENIIGSILYSATCALMLLFFDWRIGLITLAGLVASILTLGWAQRSAAKTAPMQAASMEYMTGKVLEYVQGVSVLRLFGAGADNIFDMHAVFRVKKDTDLAVEKSLMWPVNLFRYVFRVAGCAIVFTAPCQYLAGQLSFAYCVMFLFSAFVIYAKMEVVAAPVALLRFMDAALDRYERVTDMPQMAGELAPDWTDYTIEFEQVSFAYDAKQVISNMSFTIPHNKTTAIIGPSGGGKTTVCNLIARFWDVQQGRVCIGGQDVKRYNSDALLENISMVFQDVYLFEDTVENNIRFGKPCATRSEVVQAAKDACCDDFIMALPQGYQTLVGEGGSTLSGGEKQRISIARAILKDAPIVILDEATSSVDPENEQLLLKAIHALTQNKTLITIAHKMNTVRQADQILVVDKGRLVQQGTHVQLAGQPGIYRSFITAREKSAGWKLETMPNNEGVTKHA